MATALSTFLKRSEAMHAREELLMHRLLYDLKLAAARREYHLITYRSEVDHDGFDVILDDRDMVRKFQVKSVLGATSNWSIHKKLLRPEAYSCDKFSFEFSPTGVGQEGGVILMVKEQGRGAQLTVQYRYTDLHILVAMERGLIAIAPATRKSVRRVMSDLRNDTGDPNRVEIPIGAFVKARSTDALLGLAAIHSVTHSQWRFNLMQLSASALQPDDPQRRREMQALSSSVTGEIRKLITG